MNMEHEAIGEVSGLVRDAGSILFITGAGISADSGLPTYRGVGGLYDDQQTEEGMSIEEALSGMTFLARPDITWKYLWQIGSACHGARPNAAHRIIVSIEKEKPDSWVLTQNVDGLHKTAGSQNLIEVHGNAFRLFCCDCQASFDADDTLEGYSGRHPLPPRCTVCNGVIRPDVVLFGEMLPFGAVDLMGKLHEKHFGLVISIGTSGVFQYIIEPVVTAKNRGIPTVEINPTDTPVSHVFEHRIRLGAAEAMERIWGRLTSK